VDGKEVVYKTPREAEKAGIVYISHRMEEIFELCDRITVLRDGEYVGTRNICDIYIEGKKCVIKSPAQAIEAGIGFITEDRKTEGLLLEKSISENIEIANLNKVSDKGVVKKDKRKSLVSKAIEELRIKCFSEQQECNNLSGGNQQKVVLVKWIYTDPKILILDEPTRGVDIGAKKEIYNVINDMASRGVAVIMVSSELPEVLGMSDRIMVVREGKVMGILDGKDADQTKIMTLATGGTL
jgi:ribose transport system ATP-binding protein